MATRHRKRNGCDRHFVPFLRGSQLPLALGDQHRHFSLPGTFHTCLTPPCPTDHNLCLEVGPQLPRLVQAPTLYPPFTFLLLRCEAVAVGHPAGPGLRPAAPHVGQAATAPPGCDTKDSAGLPPCCFQRHALWSSLDAGTTWRGATSRGWGGWPTKLGALGGGTRSPPRTPGCLRGSPSPAEHSSPRRAGSRECLSRLRSD